MDYLIGVVNYFLVPLISLGVYLCLLKDEFEFSLKNLIRYADFTVLLMLTVRIVLLIPKKFMGFIITPYSLKYTVAAVVLAVALGVVSGWIKSFVSIKVEKAQEKNEE